MLPAQKNSAPRGAAGAPFVLWPDDCLAAGAAEVGGKALGLARLDALGANVPAWFAVGAGAFFQHVAEAGLWGSLRDGLAEASPAADTLQALVTGAPLPRSVERALAEALAALAPGPFAVRSSMAGEDAALRSWAGQLESFLFERDLADVSRALRAAWASAFSARALAYQRRESAAPAIPRLGVVVQRMLAGEVSGVAFSAHPLTGRRDHVLISAAFGLCEGVVSGDCNTDELVIDREGRELECRVAHKDLAVVADPAGAPGTVQVPVPPAKAAQRALSEEQARRLAALVRDVADALGRPQDIEWTLQGETLHLLQARPITRLEAASEPEGPHRVFDNSNIQESYCGVTTPLTFSFAVRGYASVYTQTARLVGIKGKRLEALAPLLHNLLGLIAGRVYYNIESWYRGLLILPSFQRNKEDMERMMGLTEPVDFVTGESPSLGARLRRLPLLLGTLARMLVQFAKLRQTVPQFLGEFDAAARRTNRAQLGRAGFSELMQERARLDREILDRWSVPIVNDFRVMMAVGKLRRLVERSGVESPAAALNALLAGGEELESTAPTRLVMRLAQEARGTQALAADLRQGATLEALRRAHPDFAKRLDEYIERYGDRVMGELKLETVTLREDPSFLLRLLKTYLDRPDLDPDKLAACEASRRQETLAAIGAKLGPLGRRRLSRALTAARRAVCDREAMRLARTRMFGLYRSVFLALGRRLHEAGRLDAPRDIFYLTVDELEAYCDGRAVTADLAGLTRLRQAEFQTYEARDIPHRVETRGPVYHGNRFEQAARPAPEGPVLAGIGCYPGQVTAPARVVKSPDESLDLAGHILVALRTDPGWAPLFPIVRGILVERGSTLSHSAVVARELGIPAIVGIPGLLRRVHDGQPIRMDGAAGTVEFL